MNTNISRCVSHREQHNFISRWRHLSYYGVKFNGSEIYSRDAIHQGKEPRGGGDTVTCPTVTQLQ